MAKLHLADELSFVLVCNYLKTVAGKYDAYQYYD
jgi:hypothetical protein